MRAFAIALMLAGCAGPVRPAVTPTLSSLPSDPQERGQVLDSAARRPGPESRKPLAPTQQKIVTAAASAASLLGFLFSTSANTTIGLAAPFEENELAGDSVEPPPPASDEEVEDDAPVFGPTLDD